MSNSQGRKSNPKAEKYFLQSLRDEVFALLNFLRFQWYVVALVILGVLMLITFVSNPLPPEKVLVASGQENSTIELVAKKYQKFNQKHGVSLELVRTKGAIENLELLKQGKVDVAISQGGALTEGAPGILSLGSFGYQPLWLFYKGKQPVADDIFVFLAGKRVSVAMEGSGTRTVVEDILTSIPSTARAAIREVELSAKDSIEALKAGRIDAMFLLAGMDSGNVNMLLADPEIRMMDFPIAQAMAKKLNYAEVVRVPKGAIRLSPAYPAEDVHMIATTTTVLVRNTLHPAVQSLILKVGADLYRTEHIFFDRPGGFPAFVDKRVPLSPVAQRFYSSGPPVLENYLPYWLASFLDHAWFWIVAVLAVLIPLRRLMPSYRKVMFDIVASDKYVKMFDLFNEVDGAQLPEELPGLLKRYELLEAEIDQIWVPKGSKEAFGYMRCCLEALRIRIEDQKRSLLALQET